MRLVLWVLLLGSILWVLPAEAGVTRWVSKTGSDSNTCVQSQTQTTAKLTVSAGILCMTPSNGDVLTITVGTYTDLLSVFDGGVTLPSGTSYANAATIRANTGDTVILQSTSGWPLLHIATVSYLIVEDLILDGTNLFGNANPISTTAASDHIRLNRVTARNSLVTGFAWSGQFIECTDCVAHHNGTHGSIDHGFYLSGANNSANNTCLRCIAYNNSGYGYHQASGSGGIGPTRLVCDRCNLHDNVTGGALMGDSRIGAQRGNVIKNTVSYNNGSYGFRLADTQGGDSLLNVTAYGNGTGIAVTGDTINANITNSLSVGNTGANYTDTGLGGTTQVTNLFTGVAADLFVNPSTFDFHLKVGSAALDTGTKIGLSFCGPAPDIGGFESCLWSSILNSQRAIDWSTLAGVPGGVPNRTVVCTTLNPGATVAQINSAISACGTNQVVFLNAGTYTLSAKMVLARNDVVLRGAGADQTKLVFSSGAQSGCGDGSFTCVVDVSSTGLWSGSTQNLTNFLGAGNPPVSGTYAQGGTQLLVTSTTGMSAGKFLILDQADDTTDTGDVYICGELIATCSSEGSVGGGGRCNTPGCPDSSDDNGLMQFTKIVSVDDATHVTVATGLYMSTYRTSQTPKIWWTNSPATNVGIENLLVDARSTTAGSVIMFNAVHESWIKGVAAYKVNGSRKGIGLHYSSNDTIRDSYVLGTPGGNLSYSIETWHSGNMLIENNILHQGVSGILIGAGCGNVIGYNLFIDQVATLSNWLYGAINGHEPGRCMILYEGNEAWNMVEDAIHGSGAMLTWFRNRSRGSDNTDQILGVQTNQTVPFILQSFNRYFNIVGNVLGRSGSHVNYERNQGTGSTNCDASIYNLGWGSTLCGNGTVNADSLVASTLFRWGNYDVVTGVPRWCGNSSNTGWATICASTSEVPTSAPVYPNLVPSTEILPNSFYLTAQPTTWWKTPWGTPHWPPIGPDVTGGNITEGTGGEAGLDGHAYKISAKLCFDNTSQTGGILNFNAGTCYLASSSSSGSLSGGVRISGTGSVQ